MIDTPNGPMPLWAVSMVPPLVVSFLVLLGFAIRGMASDARSRREARQR